MEVIRRRETGERCICALDKQKLHAWWSDEEDCDVENRENYSEKKFSVRVHALQALKRMGLTKEG